MNKAELGCLIASYILTGLSGAAFSNQDEGVCTVCIFVAVIFGTLALV